MNRVRYFNYIEERLGVLAFRINQKGKLNILDLHVHSEDFYLHLFNRLFGWHLINLNKKKRNVEAIDLIDETEKLIIQVTSTNTMKKVQAALDKKSLDSYEGYTFKFISISKEAGHLRNRTFTIPDGITFNPQNDIYDITSILNDIKELDTNALKKIHDFIKDELGSDIDIVKLDSNLAMIINILAEEDWDTMDDQISINHYEIDRKIDFNNLDSARLIIDDFKIHYNRVDVKYREFDRLGKNKSSSVLRTIRREYSNGLNIGKDDKLFFHVIDKIQEKVLLSANYRKIPIEELELCINILVVDAFIRCKIFKNPDNYSHVIA